ncbi:tetratricopeptide repeat protein [Streptomyces sp. NPDC002734]|uniref:tetratricopeptide repeat protein n=1 Tax=Streptomyces sp. NPDC002734 TaxID=3154426 RepID=UPI00332849B5
MRSEPVTAESLAEARRLAREDPGAGLPLLARRLAAHGWYVDRGRPTARLPYFEEAAGIWRDLLAGGAEEHLAAATYLISSLASQYSAAHADDRSLAARTEAAGLMRRLNRTRAAGEKDTRVLGACAHALAEAGRYGEAVAVQREVVDLCRAAEGPEDGARPGILMWALHDLALHLGLAGRTEESLEADREALALGRRPAEGAPRRLPALAIRLAGAALRFAGAGRAPEAVRLLDEAVGVCDRLPPEGSVHDYGFHQALQAAMFARSGADEERMAAGRVAPAGDEREPMVLRPVLGADFSRWAFSVREAYLTEHETVERAIAGAVEEAGDVSALGPAELAGLGTLLRRRGIRRSVHPSGGWREFAEVVVAGLGEAVAVERRLVAVRPDAGPGRLVRSLTDHALGCLAVGANASAGEALREARDVSAAAEGRGR